MSTRLLRCFLAATVIGVCVSSSATARQNDYFGWTTLGSSAGAGGIEFVDGALYLSTFNFFHGSRWDPALNTLRCSHVHSTKSPVQIAAGDVMGLGSKQLIVATGVLIEIYDVTTMTRLAAFNITGGQNVIRLAVGNVDGVGADEIVTISTNRLAVYSATGTLKWQVNPFNHNQWMAVAQLDADPGFEIALSSGTIYDGAAHAIQTNYVPGLGGQSLIARDVDADGIAELIFDTATAVSCLDVPTQSIQWSIPVTGTLYVDVGNVDLDATLELVVGKVGSNPVSVYDLTTQALQGTYGLPSGIEAIRILDVIPGGINEIVVGWNGSNGAMLALVRATDMKAAYTSDPLTGPMFGPHRGDLDGDGTDEIVAVSKTSFKEGSNGGIVVFDAATLDVEAKSYPLAGNGQYVNDVVLADIDGDGSMEIHLATDSSGAAKLVTIHYDGASKTFTTLHQSATHLSQRRFITIAASDLDGDGLPDLVGGIEATGASMPPNAEVYAFKGSTGAELWHTVPLATTIQGMTKQVRFANVDGDPQNELLALVPNEGIYVIEPATGAIVQKLSGAYWCVSGIAGLLVAGDGFGRVNFFTWNGSTLLNRGFKKVLGAPIDAAEYALNGILSVASEGVLRAYNVRGGTPTLLYMSANYGQGFGKNIALAGPLGGVAPISAGGYAVVPVE